MTCPHGDCCYCSGTCYYWMKADAAGADRRWCGAAASLIAACLTDGQTSA